MRRKAFVALFLVFFLACSRQEQVQTAPEPPKDIQVQTETEPRKDTPARELKKERDAIYPSATPMAGRMMAAQSVAGYAPSVPAPEFNTEEYGRWEEQPFLRAADDPLSTFSIDVDTASWSNIRRMLRSGQLPPKHAVRIEEMVNYFTYSYPEPKGSDPFSVTTELAECPWNGEHQLLHVGLQAPRIATRDLPPNNLVFLLDVSGSMNSPDKLPLLQSAMELLVEQLRDQDRVAIVVYAGAAGLVLPSTPGSSRAAISEAIRGLSAGGSTAGGEGIRLAYEVARDNFLSKGNNRVILATDGDFNVGVTSDGELERLITSEREHGIFLTVLGFGTGNIKDSKMELLADKGNGNYAYIDELAEAKKVLVEEMGGTLLTVAKDVKIQIEFNPTRVAAYRLIGYENRALRNQDFNDDRKDAGEIGAGHSVTAIYEIVPPGASTQLGSVDPLRYQQRGTTRGASTELATVKVRYKEPRGETSRLMERAVADTAVAVNRASGDFRFAAAVVELGLLLRDSEHKGNASYDRVVSMARAAAGKDAERGGLIELAETARKLSSATAAAMK
jgi:Ca-activated chloride channel family protein